jgi:CspA family cold shock protein
MANGTVKWFNDASDYGFIAPDEVGSDLYMRGSSLLQDGGPTLMAGDRVEFQTRVAGMGPEAIDVLPARPEPAPVRVEVRCACGYGIVASRPLPPCPMCGASAWEPARGGDMTSDERRSRVLVRAAPARRKGDA